MFLYKYGLKFATYDMCFEFSFGAGERGFKLTSKIKYSFADAPKLIAHSTEMGQVNQKPQFWDI